MTIHHLVQKEIEIQRAKDEEMVNSLSGLCDIFQANNAYGWEGAQLSQTDTLFDNMRWYLVSNLRQLLSQAYVEHGIVQTLVDQPVDDAFAKGFEIKTSQLSKDNIETLKVYIERNHIIHHIMQAIKWSRLYGGGAVLVCAFQDYRKPLDVKAIKEDTPLEFRGVDMWELFYAMQNVSGDMYPGGALGANAGEWYDYYGRQVHKSRVFRIIGKEAPAFIRPRLRGWGMSELERLIRSLNQYLKNQDLIFELLDEAKVDVFKVQDYNDSLLTNAGTNAIAKRIAMANQMKNYNNALTMDSNDDYIQKQMTFSGLSEVLQQIRQGIAADLKMPMSKLFGISAAGFNSGEDDIENYNSMLEGEIRNKNKFTVVDVLSICCQKLFGFQPDDLMIEFNPLRILNAKEEEEVKDSQFNRVMSSVQSGLIKPMEGKKSINKDSLLGIEIDESDDLLPPIEGDYSVKGATGKAGKKTPEEE